MDYFGRNKARSVSIKFRVQIVMQFIENKPILQQKLTPYGSRQIIANNCAKIFISGLTFSTRNQFVPYNFMLIGKLLNQRILARKSTLAMNFYARLDWIYRCPACNSNTETKRCSSKLFSLLSSQKKIAEGRRVGESDIG
jgi:hypothetical protein